MHWGNYETEDRGLTGPASIVSVARHLCLYMCINKNQQ